MFTYIYLRDILFTHLFHIPGVIVGSCGDHSIRLRPALTFQEHHADILLDQIREVMKEIKWISKYTYFCKQILYFIRYIYRYSLYTILCIYNNYFDCNF